MIKLLLFSKQLWNAHKNCNVCDKFSVFTIHQSIPHAKKMINCNIKCYTRSMLTPLEIDLCLVCLEFHFLSFHLFIFCILFSWYYADMPVAKPNLYMYDWKMKTRSRKIRLNALLCSYLANLTSKMFLWYKI